MKIKDERLKLVNDVLGGMKVLKLYAWEESMQRQIFELRRREIRSLRKIFLLDVAINVSFEIAPLIVWIHSISNFNFPFKGNTGQLLWLHSASRESNATGCGIRVPAVFCHASLCDLSDSTTTHLHDQGEYVKYLYPIFVSNFRPGLVVNVSWHF